MNDLIKRFIKEEDGMQVVEIVVIIAILVAVAIVFRKAIMDFVNSLWDKIFKNAGSTTDGAATGTEVKDRKVE